jgi:hypothetical protein
MLPAGPSTKWPNTSLWPRPAAATAAHGAQSERCGDSSSTISRWPRAAAMPSGSFSGLGCTGGPSFLGLLSAQTLVSIEDASGSAISSFATRAWPPRAALKSAPSQPAAWSLAFEADTLQAFSRRRTMWVWPYLSQVQARGGDARVQR